MNWLTVRLSYSKKRSNWNLHLWFKRQKLAACAGRNVKSLLVTLPKLRTWLTINLRMVTISSKSRSIRTNARKKQMQSSLRSKTNKLQCLSNPSCTDFNTWIWAKMMVVLITTVSYKMRAHTRTNSNSKPRIWGVPCQDATVATRWIWWCPTLKRENLAICSQVFLWPNEANLDQLHVPTTAFRTKCHCCHQCMRLISPNNTNGIIVELHHPSSAPRCNQDFQHWQTSVVSKAIISTTLTNWSLTTRPAINQT